MVEVDRAFVASHGVGVPSFLHGALFPARPGLRQLSPPAPAGRRRRLPRTLDAVVDSVPDLDAAALPRGPGRELRKPGVLTCDPVGLSIRHGHRAGA